MPVFIILLGMLMFGVIHSILAGQRFKLALKQSLGERAFHGFYRLIYNVFAVLTLAPFVALVALLPGNIVWQAEHDLLVLVLIALQVIGIVGLVLSLVQIDLGQFLGIPQAWAYLTHRPLPLPTEPLQTGGVFRLVRHPLYLFSLLIIWPVVTMTEALLAFNIGATIYFIVGSWFEERRLVETFGDAYRQYQRSVPWVFRGPDARRSPDTHQSLG